MGSWNSKNCILINLCWREILRSGIKAILFVTSLLPKPVSVGLFWTNSIVKLKCFIQMLFFFFFLTMKRGTAVQRKETIIPDCLYQLSVRKFSGCFGGVIPNFLYSVLVIYGLAWMIFGSFCERLQNIPIKAFITPSSNSWEYVLFIDKWLDVDLLGCTWIWTLERMSECFSILLRLIVFWQAAW